MSTPVKARTRYIYIGIYCCQDKLFTVKSYTKSAVGKTKKTVASHGCWGTRRGSLPPAHPTTMHIKAVCYDKNLCLGGPAYLPGLAKALKLFNQLCNSSMFFNCAT